MERATAVSKELKKDLLSKLKQAIREEDEEEEVDEAKIKPVILQGKAAEI